MRFLFFRWRTPQPRFLARKMPRRQAADWTVSRLEARRMLAGDAAASVTEATACEVLGSEAPLAVAPDRPGETAVAADADTASVAGLPTSDGPRSLVFIDTNVDDYDQLAAEVLGDSEVLLLDGQRSGLQQISEALASRRGIRAIHLISHGESGHLQLGSQRVDEQTLQSYAAELYRWRASMTEDADILIYGCQAGEGEAGRSFARCLSRWSAADVAMSTDMTGDRRQQGDWELERHEGTIEASLPFASTMSQAYQGLLSISIDAAGATGEERMELLIDGVTVQSWDGVQGDFSNRGFQTFTYETEESISPDRIRIGFSNDLYQAGVIDRNLKVDRLVIDNQVFETEDPSVYSVGSWRSDDGAGSGFRESEVLASNGYFEFANEAPSPDGSLISIRARGAEGDESMELRIDGEVVTSWIGIGDAANQSFEIVSFQADELISPDRLQIAFTNDLYLAGEVDRNLYVDWLEIDGERFETEAPSVYSSGSWRSSDGVGAGYRESEILGTNGFFQYDSSLPAYGEIALQDSVIRVAETDAFASLTLLRSHGSDGEISVDFATGAGTATADLDYQTSTGTLVFQAGETSKTVNVPLIDDDESEGNETFNFRIDNIVGGATLLAPRTATITISDDDIILPAFASFAEPDGLTFNGDAALSADRIRLTEAVNGQAGSVFFDAPLPVRTDTSFQTSFQFVIDGPLASDGADGLAFLLHDDPRGTSLLGPNGGRLGLQGATNSLAVEFDTHANPYDLNGNHVSLIQNGNVTQALAIGTPFVDLNGGETITAWIDYNGNSDQLSVFVADQPIKPARPVLSWEVDLRATVGSQAYLGFTAATGGRANQHELFNWYFSLETPPASLPPSSDLTPIAQEMLTGLTLPTDMEWSRDGANLYVAEKSGLVRVFRHGVEQSDPLVDLRDQVNSARDRGLLDLAFHPDLEDHPYVYLLFTYDPPEVFAAENVDHPLAGPDQQGNRAGRLIRLTLDPHADGTRVLPDSEVILLGTNSTWDHFNGYVNSTVDFDEPAAGIDEQGNNLRDFVNSDSVSHSVGALEFGTDGSLFVSIGDGASYNRVDPRAVRVQDIDNLSGKVLRIDPLSGDGLADNPFFNGDAGANRSKVYQYGFRNPFRMAVDPETGQLFVGDVGWTQWEELNTGAPGANFGWPYYEGGSGVSLQTGGYQDLPEAQAFYQSEAKVTPAIFALSHSIDNVNAIVLGTFYDGDTYPDEFQGDLFLNDLGRGGVRNVSFNDEGHVDTIQDFTGGAVIVVQIQQGPDGNLYYVDLDDGVLGRWVFV